MTQAKTTEAKKIRRIFPCPDYDMVGTQTYLQDMAAQGWHLQKDGIFMGVATFEKGAKKHTRYRLDPSPVQTGFVFGKSEPDADALALAQEMGWEFVDYRGEYFIYRCDDPDTPELHTDSTVQAMSMKKLHKRERANAFNTVFWALFYPLLVLRGQVFRIAVAMTTPIFLWGLANVVYMLASRFKQAAYLKQAKAALQAGDPVPPLYETASKARTAQRFRTFANVAFCAWIAVALFAAFSKSSVPIDDYTADIPFAVMEDFVQDGTFEQNDFLNHYYNRVVTHHDLLADIVEVRQNGSVLAPDGTTAAEGGYIATYYDSISPLVARGLVKDMHREDKFECWRYSWDGDENPYEEYDLYIEGADYFVAYRDEIRNPVVIIAKGDKSVHAKFFQYTDDPIPLQQWAQALADSL